MVAIAGWMNRQQQDVIAYLTEENRILREKLGHGRMRPKGTQEPRPSMCSLLASRMYLHHVSLLSGRS